MKKFKIWFIAAAIGGLLHGVSGQPSWIPPHVKMSLTKGIPSNVLPDDADMHEKQILYWSGNGKHEAIFAVNWCDPDVALAWGYRFDTDSILLSALMDSIAITDPRFSYDGSNGWLQNLYYNDAPVSLSLSGSYFMYNVNGTAALSSYDALYVKDSDFVKFGDEKCGYYDPDTWQYAWTIPVQSVLSPVPERFDGEVGTAGSLAVSCTDPRISGWATGCEVVRGLQDIAFPDMWVDYGSPDSATGPVSNSTTRVVSLGDGGYAILTFETPIQDKEGYDFAVFENSFSSTFLELAFVEVSSDGNRWVRFPATSNVQSISQVDAYGTIDPTLLHNLAGKYKAGWGTPFDLADLRDSTGIDLDNITMIKIIDVVGNIAPRYARTDARGHYINDPYPTAFASGGFDLAGVAVLNGNVGIANIQKNNQLKLYPNPTKNQLSIENGEWKIENVQILDLTGRIITNSQLSTVNSIDVSHLTTGMYLLRVQTNEGTITKKFVKD
ncbi:MAG: T9SS type A sorting domain-containing protein [Bacteroidales bacterium]|jgi:hypothetical protein|nr:T9SS type A sorting domain-containing protein [Bacteroidales bacterium]